MDKDSPRYGSRDDEDSRLFTDEPPERTESRAAGSYGSRRVDDDASASTSAPPRRGGLFSPDRDESDLPRYDADAVGAEHSRDSFSTPPSREGRGFRSAAGFDRGLEREESVPPSGSSWTDEAGARDPLLADSGQSRPGRRFSWEKDEPSDTAPQGDAGRDYTAERAGIVSSRLDRLSSGMRQRLTERSYDTERDVPDPGYAESAPAPDYETAPRPSYDPATRPAYDPPPHEAFNEPVRDGQGYHQDPRTEDSYIPPEESGRYQGYDDAPYRGAHARELADVDDRYAREYQYDAEDPAGGQADYRDFDDEDYQQFEQPYGDYQPKSRAPFLIIGSLIGVAVIGGGLFYLYQQGAGDGSVGEIPVVETQEGPVKVPATNPSPAEISSKTKLIYDRIVGEETQSEGNLVPREETPTALTPSDQSQNNPPAAPSAEEAVPEVTKAVTEQIVPEVQDSTAASSNSSDSALPLPLPPPPAGSEPTQVGQAPQLPTPVPAADTSQPANTDEILSTGGNIVVPPANEPPAPATEERSVALAQPETAQPALTTTEQTPAPSTVPAPAPAAPAAASPLTGAPPLPKQKPVPPSRQAEPGPAVPTGPIQIAPLPGSTARTETAPEAVAPAPAAPAQVQSTTRRRSASRFSEEIAAPGAAFSSTETNTNTQVATAPVEQPPLAPSPAPTQQQAPVSDGRYLIQLASFRSQDEAQAEFDKLKQRHPSLIGDYASLIQQADLGTRGVYYRLRIGPIDSKQGASKLCNSLIAAGEKDCLVRQR